MNKYLTKLATLSADAKKEIQQTAIIAATGLGAGIGGDMLSKTKAISSWKAPSWLKAGVTVGALGLVGDVAAVKVNRHIEKSAGMNKYLEKVALTLDGHSFEPVGNYTTSVKDINDAPATVPKKKFGHQKLEPNINPGDTFDSKTLNYLGSPDIAHAKDITPVPLSAKIHNNKAKILLSAAGLAGAAGLYALHNKRKKEAMNKYLEKAASMQLLFNGVRRGAQRLGGQLKTLGQDFSTAPKTMAGMKSMAPSIKPILQNRAVQVGAGATALGVGALSMRKKNNQ
jgi:hypothetical protein